jgi:adenosine deaminase
MACWSSTVPNRVPRQNRVKRMFEAGLNIVLGTDDPAMFATNGPLLADAVRGQRMGTSPRHDA